MLRPARVFPAPGTPVMKQIDFLFSNLDWSIISEIVSEVAPRLIVPESDLDISLTL